jgi:hypothetical protein
MAYAILLTDEIDEYATVHTFDRSDLWEWLQKPETFPAGASSIKTQTPNGDDVLITIGSAINDKAHALGRDDVEGVREHPVVDLNGYDAKLAELRESVGSDHIYEGLWY